MTKAVIVGGGPNGLAAGLHLARNGVAVQVLEANEDVGGGARSAELTVPGVVHDVCSAFHPMGVGSPFWREVDLTRHGLRWRWPEIDCAHPLDDDSTALLYQSIEQTADGLGADGRRWKAVFGDLARNFDDLGADLLRPIANVPSHPIKLGLFGPRALLPASVLAKAFRTPQGRALFGGIAAHVYTRLDRPLTASLGLMIGASGHRYGWPVAEGGSGAITDALVRALTEAGGSIATGVPVTSRRDIPDADIVMLDLSPAQIVSLYGDALPGRIRSAYEKYRMGSSAFKVDFAVRGDIPWRDARCAAAGTVHLGGTFRQMREAERLRATGVMPERPFTLVGQQYVADPTRSNGQINPIWAYAHVPFGYDGDATEAIVAQIERFAPGFRDIVVARSVTSVADMTEKNRNYIGGDILGGSNAGLQMLLRPRPAIDPYRVGIPGVYICSQSAPPGAGIHGMCGYRAAESALRGLPGSRR
ncbi:phytoene desaturase family protein [Gordonia liuliyuniae]|uniref:NAD(P)/FAD-dependent oxidoreductase n=1 Tax=Gordonia liuliyuniae TaxID=2911517 RepID=A0ABS9IUL4_9ACTN|nr:NAD(P)/FAD-dependent oxidoreductase [Gordonia liuliyuniae]MCF8589195.1 NAD(P)/FAD-dependent oxidoreductase [Gordonia liuliyuniae]